MTQVMHVEVIYASANDVWHRKLSVNEGDTVKHALVASGLLEHYPELHVPSLKVGIFGRICSLEQVLAPGDRIEVYRPLVYNPMESRRRRASHRQRRAAQKLSRT